MRARAHVREGRDKVSVSNNSCVHLRLLLVKVLYPVQEHAACRDGGRNELL